MYIRRYRGSREIILAKKQYNKLVDVLPFKTVSNSSGTSRFYFLNDDLNLHVFTCYYSDSESFCFSSDKIDRKVDQPETYEYLKRRSDYILNSLNLTLDDAI